MSFVHTLFEQLEQQSTKPLVSEVHGKTLVPATGGDLLRLVGRDATA